MGINSSMFSGTGTHNARVGHEAVDRGKADYENLNVNANKNSSASGKPLGLIRHRRTGCLYHSFSFYPGLNVVRVQRTDRG